MKLLAISTLLISFATVGCGDDPSLEDKENTPPYVAIVGDGNHTDEASEVTQLLLADGSWCSATLIAKRTILTAAHCFDFASRSDTTPSGHIITRTGSDGGTYTRNILRFQSLGKKIGRDDLAVAELDADIDPWNAIADIWDIEPWQGNNVVLYGFGCDNPNWNTATRAWECSFGVENFVHQATSVYTGQLTIKSDSLGMAPIIAHGDSGGPMFVGTRIRGVISYMHTTSQKKGGAFVSTQAEMADVLRNQAWVQQWRNVFH